MTNCAACELLYASIYELLRSETASFERSLHAKEVQEVIKEVAKPITEVYEKTVEATLDSHFLIDSDPRFLLEVLKIMHDVGDICTQLYFTIFRCVNFNLFQRCPKTSTLRSWWRYQRFGS